MTGPALTQEELKKQEDREREIERREQLLLNELLGETVKVRHFRYKTMKQAVVDAFEKREWREHELVETGEYVPKFNWKDEGRSGQVRQIRRLDVMTKDGWATVWDDGDEDLSPWERQRPATSAAPTGLKYRSGML